METPDTPRATSTTPTTTTAAIGILLVLAGIGLLVAQIANFNLGQYGWPLFVIVPGAFLVALGILNRPTAGFVIPGSIITITGLVLAVQNTFNLWATWSYAWALVFPGAVGVGTVILGMVQGDRKQIGGGLQAILVGLTLFAVFAVFFEGFLHVSGVDFGTAGNLALPLVLIGIGVVLLVWRIVEGLSRAGTKGPITPAAQP